MRKNVVIGVTGSIAVYKAAEIASMLKKKGMSVYVVMTDAACRFISPLTFESITSNAVATDLFSRETPWEIEHISIAKRADVFLVAPATANFIGKYANGIADDMLSTTIMATKAPVIIAPAMNTVMYQSAANQENMGTLLRRGCKFVSPTSGVLACGDVGEGKLADVGDIVDEVMHCLYSLDSVSFDGVPSKEKPLLGKKILISAGPTIEKIDPVRYITNRSSGKMGYALAGEARALGAKVTLVSGPVSIDTPYGVHSIKVESTKEMKDAMLSNFSDCDICIMAAAPADYTPDTFQNHKIKKDVNSVNRGYELSLKQTPDILSGLSAEKKNQFICGFAAETQNVHSYALEKMLRKGLDMIVANNVSRDDIGFDSCENEVDLFFPDGAKVFLKKDTKEQIAKQILENIIVRL